jgi:PAS domain S-box-containing protein
MLSVLVMGDDRTLREAGTIMGGSVENIRFTLVTSAKDVMAELSRHSFDLFISDYSMDYQELPQIIEDLCIQGIREPALVMIPCRSGYEPVPPEIQNNEAEKIFSESRQRTRELFARLGSRIGLTVERSLNLERQREHQARLCSILASINTGVFIVDERSGIIHHVNEYAIQMIDYAKDSITGLDYRTFLKMVDPMEYSEPFTEESVVKSQGKLIGKKGREIPVIFNITPVQLSGGKNLLITFLDNSSRKLAEEALMESETRFRILVETSPDAILLTDLQGNVLNANINAIKIFGIGMNNNQPSESLYDLFTPEDSSALTNFLQRLLKEGRLREEHIVRAKDDHQFPIEISSSILISSEGRPFSLIHVIRDLTSQRQAELALKASEERYRNVIEDQTEFICRFRPDGTHVFVNGAYCRYFGMTREEIVGSRFIPQIHPDDRAALERHFASLTPDHQIDVIDHRIIMPDKSIKWQRWSDRAIFSKDGVVIEYQSVGRDITDLKKAQEVDRLLSSIVRSTDDAIIALTPDGRILSWNPGAERLYGYSADEITGKDIKMLAPPELSIEMDEKMEKINRGERVDHYETKRLKKDGIVVDVSVTVSPLSDERGRIIGASAIYRDISAKKLKVKGNLKSP